jgi:hypothetical protein
MGTAVLHDTLAETLASPEQFGSFANMDIQLYMSIANVSKVLRSSSTQMTRQCATRTPAHRGSRRP